MMLSPKRYVKTDSGEIKEAGPGVSGTLLIGEGAEISDTEAAELGLTDILLGGEQKPWVVGNKPLPVDDESDAEKIAKAMPTLDTSKITGAAKPKGK